MRSLSALTVCAAAAGLAGCSDGDGDGDRDADRTSSSEADATTTTSPDDTATTTTAISATTSPTATSAPVVDALELRSDGVGRQRFGVAADVVVAALTDELGSPTDDRVQAAPTSDYGVCPGTQVRIVEWGGFTLLFTDGATPYAGGGSFTFFDWQLRDLGAATPPLQTGSGVDLGDALADVRAAGDPVTAAADEILGAVFTITAAGGGEIRGSLTGTGETDTVTSLVAGSSCGE